MPIYKLGGQMPRIAASAFVSAEATVIGDVTLEDGVSVWPGATLRADNAPIRIGAGSNVQEGAVLHTDPGKPLVIGQNVTVGHQAMLHGCSIGDGSLIGIQAVVLNGSVVGRDSLVAAGTVVTEGKVFPDQVLILGSPGKVFKELDAAALAMLKESAPTYVRHGQRYAAELERIADGHTPAR